MSAYLKKKKKADLLGFAHTDVFSIHRVCFEKEQNIKLMTVPFEKRPLNDDRETGGGGDVKMCVSFFHGSLWTL